MLLPMATFAEISLANKYIFNIFKYILDTVWSPDYYDVKSPLNCTLYNTDTFKAALGGSTGK